MNKKYFKINSLQESDDYEYWRNKTPLQRIAALEKLRRIMYGYDPYTERLQRVLDVTELKGSKQE